MKHQRFMLGFTILVMFHLGSVSIIPSLGFAYQEKPNFQGTTVRGQVTFRGSLPPGEVFPVIRDTKFCGKTVVKEVARWDDKSHGVAEVVISLEGVVKGKVLPKDQEILLANQDCRFAPPVSVTVVGSRLGITSQDPILHNTHIRRDGQTFLNIAVPPTGKVIRKPLPKAGRLDVLCDAHKFMQASVHIFDHPYATVTGKNGHFVLDHVPPGKYQLRWWHPYFGNHERTITVSADGTETVNVELAEK